MPKWTDCVKIHENCGGIVRWIEAIDRPGVGWTGKCTHCGERNIVVERMIPVRGLDHSEAFQLSTDQLRQLEWDESDTWRHNQKRLGKEVEAL
ncbi:hypothetical protein EXE43_20525 [Halorubrum sp. SS5]|uniref:hypothetical protein n=1 Tax=unclassified Halorubrum TaxID=2642239 RepID=UPI0010FA2CF0|nr:MULTISPECIES: hypothetical protein [unclassified Halorubrum]TKX54679.1 hypothetical protein EXE44_16780 [Halorubrum sp. SS7]TKX54863.1 hypothetical protein EXE42_07045 [Halorubrum sp. SP3]TKX84135.1 hypothetical protein EXE43_20525 [Halorubrum sp. SS5]